MSTSFQGNLLQLNLYRLALNGSFTIYYFIGKFDSQNVDDYALQPTMAGLNHVFTSSKEACDNCGNQAEQGHLISGTNPITPMLLDYVKIGELPDISPVNVVPFLVKNLKWRIVPVSFALNIHVRNLLTTCATYRRADNWKTLAMSLVSRLEFLLS